MRERRYRPSCFPIKTNGTVTDVVVVCGHSTKERQTTTEILNIKSLTWYDGPRLPYLINDLASVESVDGQYLGFAIGGYSSYQKYQIQDSIFGLQKVNGILEWVLVRSMDTPRYRHTVINAPLSLVPSC